MEGYFINVQPAWQPAFEPKKVAHVMHAWSAAFHNQLRKDKELVTWGRDNRRSTRNKDSAVNNPIKFAEPTQP